MIVSVTRCDKDCHRVEVNDQIVGFALRMSDDTWMPFTSDMTTRVGQASFKTAKSASRVLIDAVSAIAD